MRTIWAILAAATLAACGSSGSPEPLTLGSTLDGDGFTATVYEVTTGMDTLDQEYVAVDVKVCVDDDAMISAAP